MRYAFVNKVLLFPYYFILRARHFMYDTSILKSKKFPVKVISVGNITVGGTGKTPYIEHLLREMSSEERVAVLSRGYGRKSRGFHIVSCEDKVAASGDEPLQIKRKFPHAIVVVDEKRRRGIEKLLALPEGERPAIILLDDAFQHRSVMPDENIVLIDSSRPIDEDCLLPVGRLRDLPDQIKRAGKVVVSKCPPEMEAGDMFMWEQRLNLSPGTEVEFTSLRYDEPVAIFPEADKRYVYSKFVMMLTAIANPQHLRYHLLSLYKIEDHLEYRDHHNFRRRDVKRINNWAKNNPKSLIMTTEKDAQRLVSLSNLSEEVKRRLFYLPVVVTVLQKEA